MDRDYLLEKLEKLEKRYMDVLSKSEFNLFSLFSFAYTGNVLRHLQSEIKEVRKLL